MILKKVVRLFAWLIAGPALVYMLYNLYTAIANYGYSILFGRVENILQAGVILLYVIGIILSTQNEIIGGVITFFSPLIYITVFTFLYQRIFIPLLIMMLLIGGIFFLFTAERPS